MRLTRVKCEPNRESWVGGEKAITAAGTGEQLPDVTVPDSFELSIRGHPDNTGYIYLGTTKAGAEAHEVFLGPDDCYSFKVNNLNLFWADCGVSGEKLIYVVEQ